MKLLTLKTLDTAIRSVSEDLKRFRYVLHLLNCRNPGNKKGNKNLIGPRIEDDKTVLAELRLYRRSRIIFPTSRARKARCV